MIDVNESYIASVHLISVRGEGIQVTNAGGTCNVQDNAFGEVMIVRTEGSTCGMDFDSADNGAVGGNKWGDVIILSMGSDGLVVRNTGMSEQFGLPWV
ncbi:MAG: hypothetical protein ACYCXN_16195 [Acidimicrobiales bacterium]